jgi:hypothetical protein
MADAPDFNGKWHNQNGSEMELSVGADGRVSGWFRSAVGAVRPDRAYPLVGWCSGDLIAFCVSFESAGVASWAGQHTQSGALEKIETLWHLAQDIPAPSERDWLWSGVRAGADHFVRGPSLRMS